MILLHKKRKGFSVVELSIYIGIFGLLSFVLFNIFNDVVNFGNIGKKQNEVNFVYKYAPIEFDLEFPKMAIVPQKPTIPFPGDPPVRVLPGDNWQYCGFQWFQDECNIDDENVPCWVCSCTEEECNSVSGCAMCHKTFIEDPTTSSACSCINVRENFKDKRDVDKIELGQKIWYWYDIYNPQTVNFIPLAPGIKQCSSDSECCYIKSDDTQICDGTCSSGICQWGISSMQTSAISPVDSSTFAIDNYYQFAWSDNVGWISFDGVQLNPTNGAISGQAFVLSGGDKLSFNCQDTNSCSKSNYKVSLNTTTNELEGYAWSDTIGWTSFNCNTGGEGGTNNCGTSNYKVTVNPSTGDWDGYAWNSNIGWISFNCNTGGSSLQSICNTSNYKVMDNRTRKGSITFDYHALFEGKAYPISQTQSYNTYRASTLGNITPNSGSAGTQVNITSITGTYFHNKPLVKLVQPGSTPIYSKDNFTFVSQDLITNGTIDLKNARLGTYDLWVIDIYGNASIKKNAFTVK